MDEGSGAIDSGHVLAYSRAMLQPPEAMARAGRVHLWVCDIGGSGRCADECADVLTDDERQRAARFRFEVHRHRFLRGRAFLRERVAAFCGCDPRELPLTAGEDGKPVVRGAMVAFNLSHSEDVAVLGIAAMREIGVDVECFARRVECLPLARRFFAPAEIAALEAAPDASRNALFFRLWTSKEAAMKATGAGLRIDPRQVEVALDAGTRPLRYEGRFAPWFLANEDYDCAGGVTVSVAAPEPFTLCWETSGDG